MDSADIVIVGAGIIGLNTAYQLARRGAGKIQVIDKGRGPGEGSTGASSAVCRFKYTRPETVRLAVEGIHAYRNWRDYLEIADPVGSFHNDGVLWLGGHDRSYPEAEAARLAAFGVKCAVLDDSELAARFPAINPCTISPDLDGATPHHCNGGGTHLFEIDGGYFDPVDALTDLVTACRAKGVAIEFGKQVRRVMVESGRVYGVALTCGEVINCDLVVTAAGPWCNALFAETGLDNPWPLVPTRIQAVHFDRPLQVEGPIPVTVDPYAGIYFRSQNRGQQLIVGSVLEEDEMETVSDPDSYADYADDDFIHRKLYALQHRLRGLESIRNIRGYSGLYTVNVADVHPIIGESSIPGLLVANGFSGHGFKLAPAIGAMVAKKIAGQAATFDCSVDPDFLSFFREPIRLQSRSVLA